MKEGFPRPVESSESSVHHELDINTIVSSRSFSAYYGVSNASMRIRPSTHPSCSVSPPGSRHTLTPPQAVFGAPSSPSALNQGLGRLERDSLCRIWYARSFRPAEHTSLGKWCLDCPTISYSILMIMSRMAFQYGSHRGI